MAGAGAQREEKAVEGIFYMALKDAMMERKNMNLMPHGA